MKELIESIKAYFNTPVIKEHLTTEIKEGVVYTLRDGKIEVSTR